jgi:hypothetical protein
MGGIALCFAIAKPVFVDPRDDWLRYTSAPGEVRGMEHTSGALFSGEIELIGYDLPQAVVRSGGQVEVVLYWRALTQPSGNYQSFVHLARPLHVLWGQEDHLNPGELPTSRWPSDKHIRDEYAFQVLPGTPPGEYAINVGLYSMADGYRLTAVDSRGRAQGDSLVVGTVEVLRPPRPPTLEELGLTHVKTVGYPDEGVTLLGFAQHARDVGPSQAWSVTLFWQADRASPNVEWRALVLTDEDGTEAFRQTGTPGGYPPAEWEPGDVVRDPMVLRAADLAELAPGVYTFGVELGVGKEDAAEGARTAATPLGLLRVHGESPREAEG